MPRAIHKAINYNSSSIKVVIQYKNPTSVVTATNFLEDLALL